jgi:hypothetical protein
MNRLVVFVAFAVALLAPVSAATFYHAMGNSAPTPVVAGGIVRSDGSVAQGAGFSVNHPRPGRYDIRFAPDFFPTNCAAMVANPWAGRPLIANVAVTDCGSKQPTFHVFVQRLDGIPADKHFSFVVVGI